MNKTKSDSIMAIVMVFAIMLSLFVSFGATANTAKAIPENYVGQSNIIYCFTDFYLSLPYSYLKEMFDTSYDIVVDRQETLTSVAFDTIVQNDYFEGFGQNCIVIIDIKTFMPNEDTLSDLFAQLNEQLCKIVFVSPYDESDLGVNLDCIDLFFQSDFGRLRDFCDKTIADIVENNPTDTLSTTVFLLDGNLVQVGAGMPTAVNTFVPNLCANSIFLRILLESLADYFSVTEPTANETYVEVVNRLASSNVRMLVNSDDSYFLDVTYPLLGLQSMSLSDLQALTGPTGNYLTAIGFSHLESGFYNYLLNLQNTRGSLPVYLLGVEPISYSATGLAVITDATLNENSESLPDEVVGIWTSFLEII